MYVYNCYVLLPNWAFYPYTMQFLLLLVTVFVSKSICPMFLHTQSVFGYPFHDVLFSRAAITKFHRLVSSVQFSHSVISDSLRPHELQHARPPCPSPTLEVTQANVHRVSDAIQPSHPLLSPSPPAPNPSQHQSLFQWINSSHEVAKVLEFQL